MFIAHKDEPVRNWPDYSGQAEAITHLFTHHKLIIAMGIISILSVTIIINEEYFCIHQAHFNQLLSYYFKTCMVKDGIVTITLEMGSWFNHYLLSLAFSSIFSIISFDLILSASASKFKSNLWLSEATATLSTSS